MPNDDHPREIEDSATPSSEAELLIKEVRIQNFRSLVDVTVPLEKTITYLVGENNTGKSSLLLAIDTACGGRRATVDDLLKKEDGSRVEESVIDIIFHSKGAKFNDHVAPRLSRYAGSGPGAGQWSGIRTRLQGSAEGYTLTKRRNFLQWNQETGRWNENTTVPTRQVIELFSANYIKETRDLAEDLNRRTSDWGRILSNINIDSEELPHLEEQLENIAQNINNSSPIIKNLTHNLKKIVKSQSGIDSLNLEPLPTTIEEIARSIDVTVTNHNRKLPLRYQGLGSRSLATLMVYRSLLDIIGLDQGIRPHIITLLEEPEAHLHPQAQASARRLIEELPGQIIISTHSSILISEVDTSCIRLIRSTKTGPNIQTIDRESEKKIAMFRRFVQKPLGDIFFARLVIFVDGTAERISLPIMLEAVMDYDPSGKGITFVDMESMQQPKIRPATIALESLGGIPWLVFVDNDGAGRNAIKGVKGQDGNDLDENHDQVILSGEKQLEQMFIDAGYHKEIKKVANNYEELHSAEFRNDKDYLRFLSRNKGWVSGLVAKEAVNNNREMPQPVQKLADAIKKIID